MPREASMSAGLSSINGDGNREHPRLRPLIAYAKLVDVSLDWLVNHQGPKPKGLRRPNP